jgi:lipoprotein NlpD
MNDRERLRSVLARVNARPELIPRQPWTPEMQSRAVRPPDPKSADQDAKRRVRDLAIVSPPNDQPAPRVVARAAAPFSPPDPLDGSRGPQPPAGTAGDPKSFIWPVEGQVITRFEGGWNDGFHGLEIAAPEGSPVLASRGGRVLYAQEFISYGKLILIDHFDGTASAYGYNDAMMVKEGQMVRQGQQVATVGRMTRGGRPMLYFQIRRDARPVDPLKYLPR